MTAAQVAHNIKSPLQNGDGRVPVPAASLLGRPITTATADGCANACVLSLHEVTHFGSHPCLLQDRLLQTWRQLFCHGTALPSLCPNLVSSYS